MNQAKNTVICMARLLSSRGDIPYKFDTIQTLSELNFQHKPIYRCSVTPRKVHSMYLGPKISGVELAFSSAWWRGYCLNYNIWRMGAIKSKSPRTVLLIFVPQVYANLQLWRAPEMLLAYLRREVYTECTLALHGVKA